LIKDARYYWLLLAESRLTRWLFNSMLWRIAVLPSSVRKSDEGLIVWAQRETHDRARSL